MSEFSPPAIHPTQTAPQQPASGCLFHDGVATLDLLLAELNPADETLFDAALDLRTLATRRTDAEACVEQLFRVRRLLADRHYLAFYRVRCWARQALRIEARRDRGESWNSCQLPVDARRVDEVRNSAMASLATDGVIPATARVRFVFAAQSNVVLQAQT